MLEIEHFWATNDIETQEFEQKVEMAIAWRQLLPYGGQLESKFWQQCQPWLRACAFEPFERCGPLTERRKCAQLRCLSGKYRSIVSAGPGWGVRLLRRRQLQLWCQSAIYDLLRKAISSETSPV